MPALTAYLLLINLLAAGMMAYDKLAAMRGQWRVPENTLFGLAALGATPAIFFLVIYLRHKSNKASFRWRLNMIMGAQTILLGIWLTIGGFF